MFSFPRTGVFLHRCDQNMDRRWSLELSYDCCRNNKGRKEKRRLAAWKENRGILRVGMEEVDDQVRKKRSL